MLLLDANVLITAHNTYYALNRVPEFWEWLRYQGAAGRVSIPDEIYAEVEEGNDELARWMAQQDSKDSLRLNEDPNPDHLTHILGLYGPNLSEADLIKIGKDPFLIATAYGDTADRVVVTAEISKPSRLGANRHVPNVCEDCGVAWINPIQFLRQLDFTTGWRP